MPVYVHCCHACAPGAGCPGALPRLERCWKSRLPASTCHNLELAVFCLCRPTGAEFQTVEAPLEEPIASQYRAATAAWSQLFREFLQVHLLRLCPCCSVSSDGSMLMSGTVLRCGLEPAVQGVPAGTDYCAGAPVVTFSDFLSQGLMLLSGTGLRHTVTCSQLFWKFLQACF